LRRSPALRALVAEHRLALDQMVQPLFVCPGTGIARAIESLPDQAQLSSDVAAQKSAQLAELGVRAVMLFGIPSRKDEYGSESVDAKGVVPKAVRAIKRAAPGLVVMGDVCLCEYTDHGHCGVLHEPDAGGQLALDHDATLKQLARQAVVLADAGCDVVAPSAMADGQVDAIRGALDQHGHEQVPILAYSAKYASAFYGPFRAAAASAPKFGDRRGYQMNPANRREALQEVAADLEEGADLVMVKPALAYLDVIARVREEFDVPVAAFHVSGEYAAVRAAGQLGWLDAEAAMLECLTSIRRAGADVIISYATEWYARRARA
jgi:porphobilinogen synthase